MSDLVEQLEQMLLRRAVHAAQVKVRRAIDSFQDDFGVESASKLGFTPEAIGRLEKAETLRQHKAMQAALLAKLAEFIPEECK